MAGIYVANGAESPLAVRLNFESIRLTEEQFYQLLVYGRASNPEEARRWSCTAGR